MSANQNSVSFMKDYLKYAIEFEKYVYIWQNAMEEANNRMRAIYERRSALEDVRTSAHNALASLDTRYQTQQNYNEQEANRYKKKARVFLWIVLIDLLAFFSIGCVISVALLKDPNTTFVVNRNLVLPILSTVCMIVGFIFTWVGPICFGLYLSNKSKYKHYTNEGKPSNTEGSRRRQEILLKERESEADNDWVITVIEESVTSERQEEILKALLAAKKNLTDIYSKNILPTKYRSLNAVATLYEYLETGRCNTIQGHGGIYDTYETDLQRHVIIETLTDIRDSMYRIEANQQLLYRELQQANRTLSTIKSNLAEIEKTNAEIAHNTAISAVANQQTAAAARWMAWKAWARGY